MEGLKRLPNLAAIFTIAVIFDVAPSELYPVLLAEIREAVHRRATDLYEELQGNPSRTTPSKLDFLEEVLARVELRGSSETSV
jgi:hypothetical protein